MMHIKVTMMEWILEILDRRIQFTGKCSTVEYASIYKET